MKSVQKLTMATALVATTILSMSIGVGQPPGPAGVGGTMTVLAPCNGKDIVPYALGERCDGNAGFCPPYNSNLTGGGCSLSTTTAGMIMTPYRGDQKCGEGTPGTDDHCIEDPDQPVPCLFVCVCAPTSIPNPGHDPNDPSSPIIISICEPGDAGDPVSPRFLPTSPECSSGL